MSAKPRLAARERRAALIDSALSTFAQGSYLRRHLREVHGFFAALILRAQEAGGVAPGRDPAAEAWISLGVGLLRSIQDRLGGLLDDEDFVAIAKSRQAWLTGSAG